MGDYPGGYSDPTYCIAFPEPVCYSELIVKIVVP